MTGTTIETDEFKMTELGPLPSEWEVVMLGDVANKMKAGGTPSRKDARFWHGEIPFVLIEDITRSNKYLNRTTESITQEGLDNSSSWAVPIGNLIYTLYGTVGKVVINQVPVAITQNMAGIIPNRELIDTDFLYYCLTNSQKNLWNLIDVTVHSHISITKAKQIPIPLPPLPEQKKIAVVLSAVQEAKEKTEAVIKAARELKKSLMKHLFTYGPVSIDEAKNVPLKETEIAVVPEAWSVKTLAESVESIEYGYSISIPSEENMYGVPIISTADITKDGSILYNQVRRINPPKRLTERLLLRDGDLLFNWRNAPELVGKTAIYEEQPQRHIYASFIMRIRTDGSLSNSFLCYLLNYYRQIGVFLKLARRAVNQANYNRNEISVLRVPLPPLAVQQKTADILSGADRRIEVEENKKKALEALFKTLVSNLMTGKIRVNNLEAPV